MDSTERPPPQALAADIEAIARIEAVKTILEVICLTGDMAPLQPVACDAMRVLLSNLIANALIHGDPAGPVRVYARSGEHGLGLGPYIASEIARAHDGVLEVNSSTRETRFTFRMPTRHSRH